MPRFTSGATARRADARPFAGLWLQVAVMCTPLWLLLSGCYWPKSDTCDLTVVLSDCDGWYPLVWLVRDEDGTKTLSVEDGPVNVFKGLSPGGYLVLIEPNSEGFGPERIAYTKVRLRRQRHTIRLRVPKHRARVRVNFKTVPVPLVRENLAVGEVKRLVNGAPDAVYRQYLYVYPGDGSWKGELFYMDEGHYRITFYSHTYDADTDTYSAVETCTQDFVFDKDVIKKGEMTLTF